MGGNTHKLALGCAQFGLNYGVANKNGKVSPAVSRQMLNLSLTNNIQMLDTAISYGDSEACLGDIGVRGFKLVTKLPRLPVECDDIRGWISNEVKASLSRLKVSCIYGLLLHHPRDLLTSSGMDLYKELLHLKDSGCVEKIGISIYAPNEMAAILPKFNLDIVQAPFNLMDQRLYKSGWLNRLKDLGVEVHARSAFLQGLLLMDRGHIPSKFSPWDNLWHAWHEWLLARSIAPLQACLSFPLSFPEIDRVLVGADNVSQLTEIISVSNDQIPTDWPKIQCDDERLINPANWNEL